MGLELRQFDLELELASADCQYGEISLRRAMIGGSFSSVKRTSSIVLYLEKLKRIAPCAAVYGNPMARSTCDGSRLPVVHALPLEAQMPN